MTKFHEMQYKRPDIDGLKNSFKKLTDELEKSKSVEEQAELIKSINKLREQFNTQKNLANVNFTRDTTNEDYRTEKEFFNKYAPEIKSLEHRFCKVLISSPYRSSLEERFGKHLFNLYETSINTHKPEIEEDLKEENRLTQEYTQLLGSAKVNFRGETINLSKLAVFATDPDRETRKEAFTTKYAYMESISEKLDDIYDKLVKVRHRMAQKLGYENFVKLGYNRMLRTDYGPEEVARFRESIYKLLVPLASNLFKKQTKMLGLDKLKFYDEKIKFLDGNPTPKGDKKWILENTQRMYSDLSPETEEFFEFMMENELMDLENRDGKAGGGYCTYFPDYETPFIFANFNGTSDDIRVLTHEIGHAFQMYCSRNLPVTEYLVPTMDAAEIHSMSMEFLTLPWMENFFKADTGKFTYKLLSDRLEFLPYGVAVDEFQHYVYENPYASPEMRNKKWKELERKYLPHRNYDGEKFLEKGAFWQQQMHIFNYPFYYIDYTLADICAMQFWIRSQEDSSQALDEYVNLCKLGGSRPFTELIEHVNIKTPFGEEAIRDVTSQIEKWLKGVKV